MSRQDERQNSNSPTLLDGNIPMHHQVYRILVREILDGLWVNRSGFPGEVELTSRFNISLITSRRALERLAREGLVRRERGRRPVAVYDAAWAAEPEAAPTVFPIGPSPFEYKVLSHGVEHVPAEACAAFSVPVGTRMWTWRRLRTFGGRPHSVSFNVQRIELGEKLSVDLLGTMSMPEALAMIGYHAVRLSRRIDVAFPEERVAASLGVSLQEPLRRYTYQTRETDGQTIDWVRILLHPQEPAPVETLNLIDRTWETLGLI